MPVIGGTIQPSPNKILQLKRSLSKSTKLRVFLAELLGSTIFVFLLQSVMTQVLVGKQRELVKDPEKKQPGRLTYGEWINYALGAGFSYTVATATCSGVSSGHLNPAITLGAVLTDSFPWQFVPYYFTAQLAGSFIGSSLVYSIHQQNIHKTDPDSPYETARIFAAYPLPPNQDCPEYIQAWGIAVTTALMVVIYLISRDQNGFVSTIEDSSFVPFFIGWGFTLLLLSNNTFIPVFDVSPRLFSSLIYGTEVWTNPKDPEGNQTNFSWLPIVIPFLGAIFGTFLYTIGIYLHEPNAKVRIKDSDDKLTFAAGRIAAITQQLRETHGRRQHQHLKNKLKFAT